VTVQSLVSDGRTVFVERTDRFEAGNHSIDMDVAGAFEISDEGLIVRWRDYFDNLHAYRTYSPFMCRCC
jgi:limonene-1,2-epoxide hydrolase